MNIIWACALIVLLVVPAQAKYPQCLNEAKQPLCQIVGSNLVIIVEADGSLDDDMATAVQESTLMAKFLAIKVFNNLSCEGNKCQGVSSNIEMCPTLRETDYNISEIKTSRIEWKVICSDVNIVRSRLIWKKLLSH